MSAEVRAYFDEASRWESDRQALLLRDARRAWIVATIAGAVVLVLGVAVALLTPLKQVVPFLVRVESATGRVDLVPGYAGTEALPDSVVRHLVAEYVVQRERYVAGIAETDYEQVGAYQTAAMNQSWAAAWSRSNPDSPLNRYADGTMVGAEVQSITFLKRAQGTPEIVQVRFQTVRTSGAGALPLVDHYMATLQVAFAAPSQDPRLRALNPLGFRVVEYRREPELGDRPAAAPGGAP